MAVQPIAAGTPTASSSSWKGDAMSSQAERLVERLDPMEDFNFRHFRIRHMAAELLRTGLAPGCQAPDFELASTDGRRVRLSDLCGQAVLLHFVSYTCPVTRGGVTTMRELHGVYGDRVQFVEVLVRQAHPGERHGPYHSYEQKLDDARSYKHEESIPWTVLVDDLDGTVQVAYGGLAAAVYLIDSRGIVAFCGTWARRRRCGAPSTSSSLAAVSALRPGRAPIADRTWPQPSSRDSVAQCAAVANH